MATWPAAAGLVGVALAVMLPWRLWFTSRSVGGLPLTQVAALDPIVRLCGAALVPAALCTPLLLQPALDELRLGALPPSYRLRVAGIAVAVAAATAYPALVLAPAGPPRFPNRDDCVRVLDPLEEPLRERLASAGSVTSSCRGSRSRSQARATTA